MYRKHGLLLISDRRISSNGNERSHLESSDDLKTLYTLGFLLERGQGSQNSLAIAEMAQASFFAISDLKEIVDACIDSGTGGMIRCTKVCFGQLVVSMTKMDRCR